MKGSVGMSQGIPAIPCQEVEHEVDNWRIDLQDEERPRVINTFAKRSFVLRLGRSPKAARFVLLAGRVPNDIAYDSNTRWAGTLRLTTWVVVACNGGVYIHESSDSIPCDISGDRIRIARV